jgi:hypothetical protein
MRHIAVGQLQVRDLWNLDHTVLVDVKSQALKRSFLDLIRLFKCVSRDTTLALLPAIPHSM